jgi:hypothetical protein
MECTLQHWYELRTDDGTLSNTVILGRIRRMQTVGNSCTRVACRFWLIHDQKEFIFDPSDPMKILPEKLRPVSRLGGITYARTTQYVIGTRSTRRRVHGLMRQVLRAAPAKLGGRGG